MGWLDVMGFSPLEKAKILEVGGELEAVFPGATYHIARVCRPPLNAKNLEALMEQAERLTPGGAGTALEKQGP